MASDHDLLFGTTLPRFAQFRLDAEPPFDPHKVTVNAGASAPSLSVTVTELPSPPASPTASAEIEAVVPDEPASPARPTPGTFAYFPLLPAELRLKIW
jgi:hypothetical protein